MPGIAAQKFIKGLFIAFFALGLICLVVKGLWLPLAYLASGTHVPKFIIVKSWLWLPMAGGIAAYFKWPWILAMLSWVDMAMVMTGVFPWWEQGLQNLSYQFIFDVLLFIAANGGLICFILLRRHRRAEQTLLLNQQIQ